MIFQSCNLFINKWFPATEYGTASTIGTSSSVFMAVGFIISGIVFADPEVDVKTALNKVIFCLNCFGAAIFLLFMLTFKHEPEIPPSKVSTQEPP